MTDELVELSKAVLELMDAKGMGLGDLTGSHARCVLLAHGFTKERLQYIVQSLSREVEAT